METGHHPLCMGIEEEWLFAHNLGTPWEVFPYWLAGDAVEAYCRMEPGLRWW